MKTTILPRSLFLLLFVALCALHVSAQDSLVSVVGIGTQGYSGDGGLATLAQLSTPTGIGHDAAGNMYIAEANNNRIRKVDAITGNITTIVDSSGASGYSGDNGPAITAKIHVPIGLFVDGTGNIYFSDSYNNCVRKVDAATGIITTIAGIGLHGYAGDNGPADSATLNNPAGVFVTPNGDIYITDGGNNVIRKITATTGIITTVAGNGTAGYAGDNGLATQAKLSLVAGKVFVDAADNIYIPDNNNCVLRKVTAATGNITTLAGKYSLAGHFSGDSGLAVNAGMFHVNAVWVDAVGNIFVSDGDNHRVRKVDASTGIINTIAGGGTGAYVGNASPAVGKHIYYIWDMWPDSVGNILMADYGWGVIWKLIPCVSNTVRLLNNELVAAQSDAIYQWLDCNNNKAPVVGDTSKILSAAPSGNYAVQVTHNGCTDTSACYTNYRTGITTVVAGIGITIWPNPASMLVNITLSQQLENANLKIYNLLGQVVMQKNWPTGSNINVDISHMPTGNYVLVIANGEKVFRSSLVKQ